MQYSTTDDRIAQLQKMRIWKGGTQDDDEMSRRCIGGIGIDRKETGSGVSEEEVQ